MHERERADLLSVLTAPAVALELGEGLTEAETRRRRYEHVMALHAGNKRRAAVQLLRLLGPAAYLDDAAVLCALDSSPHDFDRAGETVHTTGMMDRLVRMPDHLPDLVQPAREAATRLRREGMVGVKVFGIGGSAAPAEILREILQNSGCVDLDFSIERRDAPAFGAADRNRLLVFASFSGNTEETVNCLDLALAAGCAPDRMIAVSAGGTLRDRAAESGIAWVEIPRRVVQPRESCALQLVTIAAVISELGLATISQTGAPFSLTPDLLAATVARLKGLTATIHWEVPLKQNLAKQLAVRLVCCTKGQSAGSCGPKVPVVLSSTGTSAVAYEFYTQLCEASKLLCHVAVYPEALHNLVESLKFNLAEGNPVPWSLYFLESQDDEPRVAQRWRRTLEEVFSGLDYCSYTVTGETAFERGLSGYCFNAWLRLYMAFLNGAEPLPVPTMTYMKDVMHDIPRTPAQTL